MRLAVLACVLLVGCGSGRIPHRDTTPATHEVEVPPARPKNEAMAQTLSIGGFLLGPMVIGIGSALRATVFDDPEHPGVPAVFSAVGVGLIAIGPSFGHWYAGKALSFGLGLRLLAVLGGGGGAVVALATCGSDDGPVDNWACRDGLVLTAVAALGTYVVGTFWDMATADDAARAWNRKHSHVHVAPTWIQGAPGLALGGRF